MGPQPASEMPFDVAGHGVYGWGRAVLTAVVLMDIIAEMFTVPVVVAMVVVGKLVD